MGKIQIDKEMCKGCGLCVIHCPRHLISLDGAVNKLGLKTAKYLPRQSGVNGSKDCLGCSFCAIVCPDCAITVWR